MVFSLSRPVENYNNGLYSSYPFLNFFSVYVGKKISKEQSFPFCKLSYNIKGNPTETNPQELSDSHYDFA